MPGSSSRRRSRLSMGRTRRDAVGPGRGRVVLRCRNVSCSLESNGIMSLVKYQAVTLDEVLCHLMARTHAASTMGAQLEQARAIYHGGPAHDAWGTGGTMHVKAPLQDVFLAQERAEANMLDGISVSKCVDALACVKTARVLKDRPALARLQKACPDRGQGELVIMVLRTYEEWRLHSPEKALASVYAFVQGLAPKVYPLAEHEEETLSQAFRVGEAKKARGVASELYGDAFLVLAEFVGSWNMRRSGVVTDSIGRRRRVEVA